MCRGFTSQNVKVEGVVGRDGKFIGLVERKTWEKVEKKGKDWDVEIGWDGRIFGDLGFRGCKRVESVLS